jgi:hypothetical protein
MTCTQNRVYQVWRTPLRAPANCAALHPLVPLPSAKFSIAACGLVFATRGPAPLPACVPAPPATPPQRPCPCQAQRPSCPPSQPACLPRCLLHWPTMPCAHPTRPSDDPITGTSMNDLYSKPCVPSMANTSEGPRTPPPPCTRHPRDCPSPAAAGFFTPSDCMCTLPWPAVDAAAAVAVEAPERPLDPGGGGGTVDHSPWPWTDAPRAPLLPAGGGAHTPGADARAHGARGLHPPAGEPAGQAGAALSLHMHLAFAFCIRQQAS